jgi:RecB family exonuclease
MKEKILSWSFGENFIKNLSDFLCNNFLKEDNCDLSRIACVFGGKRPALFLKRELSKKIKAPFYPPCIFSIDEFMEYIVSQKKPLLKINELDACYQVYMIAKEYAPQILKGREKFDEFLPWAKEIVSFIEQLDLENIKEKSLIDVEKSAAIGYDVPESINFLLQHINRIRKIYHQSLNRKNMYSRGLIYLKASQLIKDIDLDEFDVIIFCGFFYLHKTEEVTLKEIYKKGKGIFIFQGDESEWSVLKKNADIFSSNISPAKRKVIRPNISFWAGFDMHSQVCIVKKIIKDIKNPEETVIVVPRSESVIPLISEISSVVDKFNVSLGYPLKRTPLFALFNLLFKAHQSKKEANYYTQDYLSLLRHPLIKNIRFLNNSTITRILIHKIEEVLTGDIENELGGSIFISLKDIERQDEIYTFTRDTLRGMGISINLEKLKEVIRLLHQLLFCSFEELSNFSDFIKRIEELLDVLIQKSMITSFPFNLKVIEKIYSIIEKFKSSSFLEEEFDLEQIWEIFIKDMESEMISFSGLPLQGLQILGLFEVRSLSFKNVIVMDVNESVLPKLKIYEPLIPREVMLSLGINRLKEEEEILRYHFMRLISGAENVHLIYEENQEKERSRFIEELLWKKEKELNKLGAILIPKASFKLKVIPRDSIIKKNKDMIEFLKKGEFSVSKIDTYLRCPLQFYYKYILGLKEKESLLEEPHAHQLGIFIHELLEETFKKFLEKKPIINSKFRKYFFEIMEERFKEKIEKRMKSDSFLLKEILKNRLEKFLDNESQRDVVKIVCLEEEFRETITLGKDTLRFVYKIDRVDQYPDGSYMVIDYKTGDVDLAPKRLDSLKSMEFTRAAIKENIKSFQLPLYYYFIKRRFPGVEVNAQFYSIRTLESKSFISKNDLTNKEEVLKICLRALEFILEEILDLNKPFTVDNEERNCGVCSFNILCRRS